MAKKTMTNTSTSSWNQLLDDFINYATKHSIIQHNSAVSYRSYLNNLNSANGQKTIQWLNDSLSNENPEDQLMSFFNNSIRTNNSRQWSALKALGRYFFGVCNATKNLQSIKSFDRVACELVARSAIFCSKDVAQKIRDGELGSQENTDKKGNSEYCWYHHTYRRISSKERIDGWRKGDTLPGTNIILDDNTYANNAIKYAVIETLRRKYGVQLKRSDFKGFTACHVWDNTCYNEHYHTSVANLILLPNCLADLTDHCDAVKEMLRYRVYEIFNFYPAECNAPSKPKNYGKIIWR